jgi:hypothetical protein
MTAERPDPGENRVVTLRPRPPQAGNDNQRRRPAPAPVGDLASFERNGDHHDDYRHRMLANGVAFAFCLFLVIAGVWLVSTLAQMRKDQDCVLSGRRGCTPVEVPVRSRW